MLSSTRRASRANGRVCTTRSCARRSLDAATIFIAFVICCVDFTARMRRRMSMSDGTEFPAEFFQRLTQLLLDLVVEDLLLRAGGRNAMAVSVKEVVRLVLVLPQAVDGNPV